MIAFVAVLLTALVSTSAFAQGPTSGGFSGIVRDDITGSPIPGAKVVLRNSQFNTQAVVITDENGSFVKKSLPPGDYEIEVSANNYLPQMKVQTLYATATYTVLPDPFRLRPEKTPPPISTPPVTAPNTSQPVVKPTPMPSAGVQSQTAETGESLSLNPRRSAIFGISRVNGTPLGSSTLTRSFDELAFLVPGVNPPPQAIGSSVGPGLGGGVGTSGQFSVNGLRSRANNFTVDGSDNNDEDIGVRRQGFFTLVPQPIESVQEFQIITLLAPAEFGRNLGAQVNALSKSGGNAFHGTLYGLLNSSRLNARNTFDNASGNRTSTLQGNRFGTLVDACFLQLQFFPTACPDANKLRLTNFAGAKDSMTLSQGGFAIGGRIVRDKLFFFTSGEGQFLNAVKEKHFVVPTVEQRGLFGAGALGLQQCQAGFNAQGQCLANYSLGFPTSSGGDAVFSLFPFANDPTGIYGRNTYTQALPANARGRIFSGKVDYNFERFNNTQTFTARYNYTDDRRDLTDVGGALFSAVRPRVRTDNFSSFLAGGLTANLSNELRLSWGRTKLRFDELRDTSGFLSPISSSRITDADERRFLLNAPILFNLTLPFPCNVNQCIAAPFANFSRTNFSTAPNSGLGEIGELIIAGFSPVGVDVFNFPQQRENNTYQIADAMRYQFNGHGQHSLAFGGEVRREYLKSDLPRNSRPLVTFNGGLAISGGQVVFANPLDLAAAGAPSGFFQSLVAPGKDAKINLSYNQYNLFVQDDWRVRKNLNVSFGVRYELNNTPEDADSKIESTFSSSLPDYIGGLNKFIDGRDKIYEGDKKNFAPRVGVAYSPNYDTVIRGGFGVYFDQILGSVVSQSRNVFPTFTTVNFGGGFLADNDSTFTLFNPRNAVFDPVNKLLCNGKDTSPSCDLSRSIPLIKPGTLNTINPVLTKPQLDAAFRDLVAFFPENGNSLPFGSTLPTRRLATPRSYQYSFGFERRIRSLGADTIASVAYVGTTGRKLLRFTTPNLGTNYVVLIDGVTLTSGGGEPTVTGSTFTPGKTSQVPFSGIGPINQFETTGRSTYDSLQVGLRGRLAQKLQYQVNYVYGKVEDDVSDVFDLAGASALPQNSLTFAGEYAPANFDVRHRFTYDFIYDLPQFKSSGRAVRDIFGDWHVAGTGKFNTGQPYTVNTIFDVNLDGNLTDRLNNTQYIRSNNDRSQPLSLTCTTPLQCQNMLASVGNDGSVGRNTFRTGSVLDLDMSVSRRFRFTENHNLQFRADFFNFINHANFGVPVRFLEAPGFGRVTDTITPGRRIQFGLKYSF